MGLTLIKAATGCVKQPESRLEHLAVINTFAEVELLSWLPFMNIAVGASDEGYAAARALLHAGCSQASSGQIRSQQLPIGSGKEKSTSCRAAVVAGPALGCWVLLKRSRVEVACIAGRRKNVPPRAH